MVGRYIPITRMDELVVKVQKRRLDDNFNLSLSYQGGGCREKYPHAGGKLRRAGKILPKKKAACRRQPEVMLQIGIMVT